MIKKVLKNAAVFLVAVFFIVYFCIQVKNIFIDSMETEYATLASIDDTLDMKCYIVRNETLVSSDIGGTYNYVISEGEKLAKGQTIANIYTTDSEYKIQEQIRSINEKVEILKNSSVEHNYFTLNVSKIDKDIASLLSDYRGKVMAGEYNLATQNKNDILSTLNKRYLVVNALTGFDDAINNYEDAKTSLMSRASGNEGSIYAQTSGYFYSDVDGYENVLTPELIFSGTVSDILEAIKKDPEAVSKNTVGKIISEFEWYTVCVVNKETAMKFSTDSYYEISYPYSVGAKVKSILTKKIIQSDSEDVVLVFQSAANTNSFNFMRSQVVEVKLDSYAGLRIKKEALRIVDGEEGVYILNGNTVEFKRACKVYENDGYYIISVTDPEIDNGETDEGARKTPYIEMYDAVINNGKDLFDGKIIG